MKNTYTMTAKVNNMLKQFVLYTNTTIMSGAPESVVKHMKLARDCARYIDQEYETYRQAIKLGKIKPAPRGVLSTRDKGYMIAEFVQLQVQLQQMRKETASVQNQEHRNLLIAKTHYLANLAEQIEIEICSNL